MDTLLFATNNKNKAREVEEALKKFSFLYNFLKIYYFCWFKHYFF